MKVTIRKCKECKTEFQIKHKRHYFCSENCKKKYYNSRAKRIKVNCSQCGKEITRSLFSIRTSKNFFCNKECGKKFRAEKTKDIRKCPICEKEFICKKGEIKTYCSMKCQNEWQRKYRSGVNHPSYKHDIPEEDRTKKCEMCGIEMIGTPKELSTKKYCSYSCKTRANKRTMTFPHRETIKILKSLKVGYSIESPLGRYSIDCSLLGTRLLIEVMGTFWHCDIREYKSPVNNIQTKAIERDRRKKVLILEKGFIPLYIWEKDITKDYNMCEQLVAEFIKKNGNLSNYHSANYITEKGNLRLRNKIVVPFFEK